MGLVWNVRQEKWNRKVAAFETFKNQNHHIKIPKLFVVPDQDPAWPSDMCGLKLGILVSNILSGHTSLTTKQKAQLDTLGSWNETMTKRAAKK
ncbi:Aste57867_22935 [Aphanomyces stellatus]|uniref:Aste57867_22935 protein n=1 Tax=Aphanomyces stellatus TaxID=120398 RepID=A0A485LLI2_9STRA|nr:hypothetical protein As57867_022864 [Aphanomyces stellatus]VFT99585.1 Aste57867_22935 [Aphanomyces stellatus]